MRDSPETNAIRRRMEDVRCDLDEDVQVIVEGARGMADWRSYVKSYPWVCLGAALAVGYVIVPRRPKEMQPDAAMLAELAKQSRLLAASQVPPQGKASGILLALVGSLVMRGVSSFVGQQADKLFAKQAAKPQPNDQP